MKKIFNLSGKLVLIILFSIIAFSCVPTKKLSYFNDISDANETFVNPKIQKVILPFDRLHIRVFSIDLQTRQIFDSPDEVRYSGDGNSLMGYQVDEEGNINFPFVGKINIGSLTTAEASVKIQNALNEYVPNTTVVVRYIDNQVSVLGEVERQGVYTFKQDKINIYEALALGGGLTRYGNRKNIILIRQESDRIMHHRLDLSDSKIASKEYYYVQPNDVIVVEPLKSISTSYTNITYQTILSSITTLIAVLLFTGVSF